MYGAIADDDVQDIDSSPASPSLSKGPSTSTLQQGAEVGWDSEGSSDLEIVEVKGIPSTGKCANDGNT